MSVFGNTPPPPGAMWEMWQIQCRAHRHGWRMVLAEQLSTELREAYPYSEVAP